MNVTVDPEEEGLVVELVKLLIKIDDTPIPEVPPAELERVRAIGLIFADRAGLAGMQHAYWTAKYLGTRRGATPPQIQALQVYWDGVGPWLV